jgi:hypothetical protein
MTANELGAELARAIAVGRHPDLISKVWAGTHSAKPPHMIRTASGTQVDFAPIALEELCAVVGGDRISEGQCFGLTAPDGGPVVWKPSMNLFVSPTNSAERRGPSGAVHNTTIRGDGAPPRTVRNTFEQVTNAICPGGVTPVQ